MTPNAPVLPAAQSVAEPGAAINQPMPPQHSAARRYAPMPPGSMPRYPPPGAMVAGPRGPMMVNGPRLPMHGYYGQPTPYPPQVPRYQ